MFEYLGGNVSSNNFGRTLNRRLFLKFGIWAGATSVMISRSNLLWADDSRFSVSIELPASATIGKPVPFTVGIVSPSKAPARVRSVQVFGLGERSPRKAMFELDRQHASTRLTGRVHLGQSQNVMVVAELADGSLVHARQFVRVKSA